MFQQREQILRLIVLVLLGAGASSCSTGAQQAENKRGGSANSSGQPATSTASDGDFTKAGEPTPITGAFLAAFRDPPGPNDGATVEVYGVLTDKASGKPLPKPVDIASAQLILTADPTHPVPATIITDPTVPYHVVYTVPKAQISTKTPGQDVVAGELQVVPGPTAGGGAAIETSDVTWLANLALQADRIDYGGLRIGTAGSTTDVGDTVTLHILFSGGASAAQNAALKGLGAYLAISGGSCPALAETSSATIAASCDITLAPKAIGSIDQFVTLTYFNGVRQAYASWPLQGSAVATLASSLPSSGSTSALTSLFAASSIASDGKRLVVADAMLNRVLIWNSIPGTSNVPPDLVIGQADTQSTACNGGVQLAAGAQPGLASMCAPTTVSFEGQSLAVADGGNHRVLIWHTFPTSTGQSADLAIGPFASPPQVVNPGTIAAILSQGGMPGASPAGVQIKNGKLLIADAASNTLDVWNSVPTSATAPADFQLGPNINLNGTSQPLALTAAQYDGTRLFVLVNATDENLLVWNALPTAASQGPDFVLGKKSTGAQDAGVNLGDLTGATVVYSDGTSLWVPDPGNNRVLYWRTMPTTNDALPDMAMGFDDGTSTATRRDPTILAAPTSIVQAGGALFVSELTKVLIEPVPPLPSTQPAGGGTGSSSAADGNLASILTFPSGGVYDFGRVGVPGEADVTVPVAITGSTTVTVLTATFGSGDFGFVGGQYPGTGGTCGATISGPCSLRVAFAPKAIGAQQSFLTVRYADEAAEQEIALSVAAEGRAMADMVVGAPSFGTQRPTFPDPTVPVDGRSILTAASVYSDGTIFLAADPLDKRILLWQSVPTTTGQPADLAIGQPDLTTPPAATSSVSASTMLSPGGIATCGGKLIVSDNSANRVLIWNRIPTQSGVSADVVLGQPDMQSTTANNGGLSASSLDAPYGVYCDGTRLFVADSLNGRVLIWSTVPTTSATPANLVVGAPDMVTGGIVPIQNPRAVIVANGELLVTDDVLGELVIWNQVPTTNGVFPDLVLHSFPVNHGPWVPATLSSVAILSPSALAFDGQRLYMADMFGGYVVTWDGLPTSPNSPVTAVIGDYSGLVLGSSYGNGGITSEPTQWNILGPTGLATAGGKLFVGSSFSDRILRYSFP